MSVVNGSDLYMWMDGELVAYSTSYTITMNMETRPRTNKGSGVWRSVLPGMFSASASCDGLYVFESSAARIVNAMLARNPVTLQLGVKATGTDDIDETKENFSGDYYITSFELNATDAENATYSASFELADSFESVSEDYWWVATDGSDATGTGEYSNPWLTLGYAVTQVTTPGETINMKAGTYNVSTQIDLPAGVSIKGQGDNTILLATGAVNPLIELSSIAEGTAGNQSISYLKLDGGSLTGTRAIYVYLRSGVAIHHVTVEDFTSVGVQFDGSLGATPTTHATGNIVYSCTFTNTCERSGAINFAGQSGMSIHDNTITGYQRTKGHDPTLVSAVGGYNKGLLFYNNILNMDSIYLDTDDTTLWGFHFEHWDCQGGHQVYNNTFNGGHVPVDVGGTFNIKGDFDYSWDIHHNTWQYTAQYAAQIDGSFGLVIEGGVADVRIHNNYFKNVPTGISCSILQASKIEERIYIYYNVFEDIGFADNAWAFGIWVGQGVADAITRYIHIYNNVIKSNASGSTRAGIVIESTNSISYVYIRNNIILNVAGYGCIAFWDWVGGHTIDEIDIQYNIYYNNVNSNDYYYYGAAAATNLTDANNIEDNPDFISASNFRLQAGSPAINAGVATGQAFITTDYAGATVADPPEIGAYEYV